MLNREKEKAVYYYKVGIEKGFYRLQKDRSNPEEYNYDTYEWVETKDAFEAFFMANAHNYSDFTLAYFANKYYELYSNPATSDKEVKHSIFFEMCNALGFLDDYSEINEILKNKYPFLYDDSEHLKKYISDINDSHVLGTIILTEWRALTYWTYSYSILNNEDMVDAREWFITAFKRLIELSD